MWIYIYRILNKTYWNSMLRDVPVFLKDLEHDKLGDFQCTPAGINSILLGKNQNMTVSETIGVLLHEMCHQAAFQKSGIEIDPHGREWQNEMRKAGFCGVINEYTDGLDRFTKEDTEKIMSEYRKLVQEDY